jgi:DNA-binding SARP family transcriptional activator
MSIWWEPSSGSVEKPRQDTEDTPRTARQNLHTYLWQLRHSLRTAPCGRISIAAQHPGYLMQAAPGELDWDSFCQFCSAAARALPEEPGRAGHLHRRIMAAE